jgi:hypothetical protein
LLLWLAPVGFVQSVLSTAPAVFMVKGRTDVLLKLNLAVALLHIACWLTGSHWGLRGIAAGYLIATLASTPVYLATTARLLALPIGQLVSVLGAQVLLGIGVFVVTFAASYAVAPFELPPLALLLIAGSCGAFYGIWHIGRFDPDQMLALRRTLRLAS